MRRETEPLKSLRVCAVQMVQVQGDISANTAHLQWLLRDINPDDVDLMVLPEMWNTGFVVNNPTSIEHSYESGIEEMHRIADNYDCAVYGSLLKSVEEERYANVGVWVSPHCTKVYEYRKIHLFGPGGEAEHFVSGGHRLIVHYRGWRILLSICYDLRFPIALRYANDALYDLLLCVANWPIPRHEAWRTLLHARALENQCYVVGCNRVGDGPKGLTYPGYSMVISPKGKELAALLDPSEGLICHDLDLDGLSAFRQKFPVLDDADVSNLTTIIPTEVIPE